MHFHNPPPKCLKLVYLYSKMGSFGHGKTSGDMVGRCMPNYGSGGCPGTQVMTIFGFYVGRHFPNIGDFKIYGGIWRYMKVFEGI